MKYFKSKITICILLVLCIFLLFLVIKNNKKEVTNENTQNIIWSIYSMDESGNITYCRNRIFKLDSNGKCYSCKVIFKMFDNNILQQMIFELESDPFEKYSNVQLQDYEISYNDNTFYGLSENDIKNQFHDLEESVSNNKNTYCSCLKF